MNSKFFFTVRFFIIFFGANSLCKRFFKSNISPGQLRAPTQFFPMAFRCTNFNSAVFAEHEFLNCPAPSPFKNVMVRPLLELMESLELAYRCKWKIYFSIPIFCSEILDYLSRRFIYFGNLSVDQGENNFKSAM